ncbi:MAG: type II secretion system protein GspF [Desulfobulbus propionicus]|nr:MAG: type II secretion system protein GspF [Desulfobulbus propionicus]
MPLFDYTALNARGKKSKGMIEAESLTAARTRIRSQGLYPVDIKERHTQTKGTGSSTSLQFSFSPRIRPQDISIATRQLATLLNAGISLIPALDGLIAQTENKGLKTVFTQIKDTVNEGNSMTVALEHHPRLFSRIYINMVRAGEASGSLGVVLERLAEFGENQQMLKSRITAALLYPLFMAVVGILVLFLLITFIVPSITSVFEGTQQALPLPTILLIGLSGFLKQFWWVLLLVLTGLFFFFRFLIKLPRGRRAWDRGKLTLPGLRDLNLKIGAARFGRTLSSLLASGVPLIAALNIVKNIVNNTLMAEVISTACEEIEKGKSLSQTLNNSRWFPPMLVQMIAVGEQSGALEGMLDKAARSYEREVEAKVLGLTSLIEPIMILVMGVAVAFIVVSILLPIFEMNQLIR